MQMNMKTREPIFFLGGGPRGANGNNKPGCAGMRLHIQTQISTSTPPITDFDVESFSRHRLHIQTLISTSQGLSRTVKDPCGLADDLRLCVLAQLFANGEPVHQLDQAWLDNLQRQLAVVLVVRLPVGDRPGEVLEVVITVGAPAGLRLAPRACGSAAPSRQRRCEALRRKRVGAEVPGAVLQTLVRNSASHARFRGFRGRSTGPTSYPFNAVPPDACATLHPQTQIRHNLE